MCIRDRDVPLNTSDNTAYEYLHTNSAEIKALKKKDPEVDLKIRDFMCREFYDIRTLDVYKRQAGDTIKIQLPAAKIVLV